MANFKKDWSLSTRYWSKEQSHSFVDQARHHFISCFAGTPETLSWLTPLASKTSQDFPLAYSHLYFEKENEALELPQVLKNLEKDLSLTLQFAKTHKIPFILLECFHLPTLNASRRFEQLLHQFQNDPTKAQETCSLWQKERTPSQDILLPLCRLLHRWCKQEEEITFCLGSRYRLDQCPSFEELEILFSELKNFKNLKYWHHTAYTHLQEKMGLHSQEQWLERFFPLLAGVTFQDCYEYSIGLPPGVGGFPFTKLSLPPLCQKTIELAPQATWMEYDLGLSYLNQHLQTKKF
jgi:hypothetical protein